jgi:hypothetical protein
VAKQGSAVLPAGWLFIASKGLHITAYATLAALVCWLPARRWLRVLAWVSLLGHGALTEFLQRFVEGRHGSTNDVALDAGSALIGLTAALAWRRWRTKQQPPGASVNGAPAGLGVPCWGPETGCEPPLPAPSALRKLTLPVRGPEVGSPLPTPG